MNEYRVEFKDDPLVWGGKKHNPLSLDPDKHKSQVQEAFALCSEDFLYYLYTIVKTKDQVDRKHPIKHFPQHQYITWIVRNVLFSEPIIVWPKSRRMKATWLAMALITWEWWRGLGFSGFIQSKKEEDSGELVSRCWFIYEHHPEWMRYPKSYVKYTEKKPPKIDNKTSYSWIWGIPQGPDQLRQYTVSLWIGDEVAFHEQFRAAWAAARPTLEGGGRALLISTSNGPDFFHDLCFDTSGEF